MTTAKWDRFEIDGEEIEVVISFRLRFWDQKWKKREGGIMK